ncbi:MAG: hypothetical protein EXR21_00310 [Flavobacteriaceae bacterium]|nr:hypothetical protein [Flavobacteriaceae bacterium]
MPAILTEPHYFPCIGQVAAIVRDGSVYFDMQSRFVKQTYRNRCLILSANGPQSLTVPIMNGSNYLPMSEVIISPDHDWKRQHLRAIRSAYSSSPYYLFYSEKIETLLNKNHERLMDLLLDSYMLIFELFKTSVLFLRPGQEENLSASYTDLRNLFSPKVPSTCNLKPYSQVFTYKFEFVPGLSVLDFLFNCGPNISYLTTI